MRRAVILFAVLHVFFCVTSGQDKEPSQKRIRVEKLGAEDLLFSEDTVEMSVISASRSSKRVGELPITIHVVTKEEILLNHYTSLTDIIKNLPGARVSQPGTGELGESFQLRGLVGNLYTMILINGLPVKPSAVIGMPVLAQLPIRQAERIEVIYGPAAAIYGADAVSGVINIITREAEKGTFVMSDISLGQNDFRNADFMVGGKTGKNKNIMQYSFYGSLTELSDMNVKKGHEETYNPLHYPQSKGVKYNIGSSVYEPLDITEELLLGEGIEPDDFIKENYPGNYEGSLNLPAMEDLPAESNMLGFQLRYRGVSLSYNNMYRHSASSLGQSSFLFKYNNPQTYWGENIRSTTLSYNHEWSPRFFTTTNISNLIYRMDNNSSFGVTFIGYTDKVYRYSAGNDILVEQLFTLVPSDKWEIMSGITYQYSGNLPQTSFLDKPFNPHDYSYFSTETDYSDTLTGNFGINPLKYHNVSAFAQSYYSISSFRFMGGIRIDANSRYGTSINPRISGLYILNPRTSFRSSIGFAYKSPPSSMAWQSLAYRAGENYDSIKYIVVPNPDLEPEKYTSVELGLIKTYKKRFRFDVSVYYNSIKNLILDQNIRLAPLNLPRAIIESDTSTVLTSVNSKDAISRLYGIQATFRADDLVRSIHMNAELNLNFAKSSSSFPDIFELASNYLSNFKLIPNHFGQLKISFQPFTNLYIRVTSIWESSWLRLIIPIKDVYNELFNDMDGFYSMDIVANYKIGLNLNGYLKVNNVFDEKYGFPAYSGMNTPLPYNPQMGRSIQIGLSYSLN